MKNALVLSALLVVSGVAVAAPSRNLSQASTFKLSVTAGADLLALADSCPAAYGKAVVTAVQNTVAKAKNARSAEERQHIARQESIAALRNVADVEPPKACVTASEQFGESVQALSERAGAEAKLAEVQRQARAMFGM